MKIQKHAIVLPASGKKIGELYQLVVVEAKVPRGHEANTPTTIEYFADFLFPNDQFKVDEDRVQAAISRVPGLLSGTIFLASGNEADQKKPTEKRRRHFVATFKCQYNGLFKTSLGIITEIARSVASQVGENMPWDR